MCLNKVPVYHKEEKSFTYHSCGKCAECLNVKALRYTKMLQNQFALSETQMACLVTLKYDNDNVPLVKVVTSHHPGINRNNKVRLPFPDSDGNYFVYTDSDCKPYDVARFYLLTDRCKEYFGVNKIDEIYAYSDEQKENLKHLLKPISDGKVRGTAMAKNLLPNGVFPILFHYDVQLYVKRVRDKIHTLLKNYFKKSKNEKLSDYVKRQIRIEMSRIKVFYVGEYGPQSFRPHYHLLLFFDSSRIAKFIKEILCSSWSLGSVDFKFCDSDGAGKYVSEYCNSIISYPPLYKFFWNKAKSFHSIRIGVDESKEFNQDIHQITFDGIKQKIISRNGKFEPSSFPFSLETYFFPKCYRYSKSDDSLLLARYTIYDTVTSSKKFKSINDIISFYCNEKFGYMYRDIHPVYSNGLIFKNTENIVSTFRSMLYTSCKFLRNCEKYHISPYNYLQLIKQYYNDKNSYTLQQWYQLMQDDSTQIKSNYLINYYDNIYKDDIVNADTNDLIELFASQVNCTFDDVKYALNNENLNKCLFDRRQKTQFVMSQKIKHKVLNDKNINYV